MAAFLEGIPGQIMFNVPSALAIPASSIPIYVPSSPLSPTLYKYIFLLAAFLLCIWIIRLGIRIKKITTLWKGIRNSSVIRVDGVAASQLTRESTLALLRSRSVHRVEEVLRIPVQTHVIATKCKLIREKLPPATTTAAPSTSPPPAVAVPSPQSEGQVFGSSYQLDLTVSCSTPLSKVEVFVGVPCKLIHQLYHQTDKFHQRTGFHGVNLSIHNALVGMERQKLLENGHSALSKELPAPSAVENKELEHSRPPLTSKENEAIEMAVLPALSAALAPPSENGHSFPSRRPEPLRESDTPGADAIQEAVDASSARDSLLLPGEYLWKSNCFLVRQPRSTLPSPCTPAAIQPHLNLQHSPEPSASSASRSSSSSSSSSKSKSKSKSKSSVSHASATSSHNIPQFHSSSNSRNGTPPVLSPPSELQSLGSSPSNAGSSFQQTLTVSIPFSALQKACSITATAGSDANNSSAKKLLYPILVHVSSLESVTLTYPSPNLNSTTAGGTRKPNKKRIQLQKLLSQITLAEPVIQQSSMGGPNGSPIPPSSPSPTESNSTETSFLSKFKFEKQLLLISSVSPLAPPARASDAYAPLFVFEMEELYGLNTAVKLPRSLHPSNMIQQPVEDSNGATSAEAQNVNSNECVVCMSEIKDVIILPCRHVCVCQSCFHNVEKCPVCRSVIQSHMRFEAAHLSQPIRSDSATGARQRPSQRRSPNQTKSPTPAHRNGNDVSRGNAAGSRQKTPSGPDHRSLNTSTNSQPRAPATITSPRSPPRPEVVKDTAASVATTASTATL